MGQSPQRKGLQEIALEIEPALLGQTGPYARIYIVNALTDSTLFSSWLKWIGIEIIEPNLPIILVKLISIELILLVKFAFYRTDAQLWMIQAKHERFRERKENLIFLYFFERKKNKRKKNLKFFLLICFLPIQTENTKKSFSFACAACAPPPTSFPFSPELA